jgi:Subtilase family
MSDVATFEHPDRPLDYLPGQVVLRVRPEAVRPHLSPNVSSMLPTKVADLLPEAVTGPLDYLHRNAGLRSIEPLPSGRRPALLGTRLSKPRQHRLAVTASVIEADTPASTGISIGRMPAKYVTRDLVRHINRARAIDIFEPVPARWLTTSPASADPVRNLQWGPRAIGWFDAERPDTSSIHMGIIDSGIDRGHPAFAELKVDYNHDGTDEADLVGHGTHVAGTVAAAVDDAAGVAGMTQPRLSVWKVLPDKPQNANQFYIDGEPYINALHAAADSGLVVLNMSLAGSTPSTDWEPGAIRELVEAGVNVVASTGNGYQKGDPVMYPAAYDGVLAVGSIAEDLSHSAFSGTGAYVDLVAPGSNVLSVAPMQGSKYRAKRRLDVQSGTSMAAAHVSAALALLAAKYPSWTAADRAERLRQTAKKLPGMRGHDWTRKYGFGMLDVRAALESRL